MWERVTATPQYLAYVLRSDVRLYKCRFQKKAIVVGESFHGALITTTAVRVKLHSLSNWRRQGVRTRDLIASCGFIDPTLARSSVLYPAAVILLSNPQAQL